MGRRRTRFAGCRRRRRRAQGRRQRPPPCLRRRPQTHGGARHLLAGPRRGRRPAVPRRHHHLDDVHRPRHRERRDPAGRLRTVVRPHPGRHRRSGPHPARHLHQRRPQRPPAGGRPVDRSGRHRRRLRHLARTRPAAQRGGRPCAAGAPRHRVGDRRPLPHRRPGIGRGAHRCRRSAAELERGRRVRPGRRRGRRRSHPCRRRGTGRRYTGSTGSTGSTGCRAPARTGRHRGSRRAGSRRAGERWVGRFGSRHAGRRATRWPRRAREQRGWHRPGPHRAARTGRRRRTPAPRPTDDACPGPVPARATPGRVPHVDGTGPRSVRHPRRPRAPVRRADPGAAAPPAVGPWPRVRRATPRGTGSGGGRPFEPFGPGARSTEPAWSARPGEATGRGTGPSGYGSMAGGAGGRDAQDHRNRYVVPTDEVFDIEIAATDAVLAPEEPHR